MTETNKASLDLENSFKSLISSFKSKRKEMMTNIKPSKILHGDEKGVFFIWAPIEYSHIVAIRKLIKAGYFTTLKDAIDKINIALAESKVKGLGLVLEQEDAGIVEIILNLKIRSKSVHSIPVLKSIIRKIVEATPENPLVVIKDCHPKALELFEEDGVRLMERITWLAIRNNRSVSFAPANDEAVPLTITVNSPILEGWDDSIVLMDDSEKSRVQLEALNYLIINRCLSTIHNKSGDTGNGSLVTEFNRKVSAPYFPTPVKKEVLHTYAEFLCTVLNCQITVDETAGPDFAYRLILEEPQEKSEITAKLKVLLGE